MDNQEFDRDELTAYSIIKVLPSNISDPKRITESFLKNYSDEELTVLSKIPRLYRNKRACQYMQDIIHINPDKVSKSNINNLIEHQLFEGIIGLSADEKLQKGDKLLTREEKKLYDAILKTRWTLKHITFDYNRIKEKGNVLKSLKQRMRENDSLDNSHAFQETGKDDSVFFTLGSPHHKGAGFLQGQGACVIALDFNPFSKSGRCKEILSGLQLSDHWFQYINDGYFSQTYGNTRREVKFYNDKEASFALKGHKIYSYYRHDGAVLMRTVFLGQEAVTGAEFLPFIAYNLILELRYIGGQYRQHIFNNLGQSEIIESAIDTFYHSSNFEVTIPSQISLNSPYITITPQYTNPSNTVNSALLMHEAISERQIDKIKNLLAAGIPIDILDEKGVTPLTKALLTSRYNIAYFLIDSGANLELKYQNYTALAISILAGRMDIVEKILSKKIMIDKRDSTVFRQVDINRDLNAISAGISRGYLSYFLRVGLNVEKFFPYIMCLLSENMLSENIAIHSINLLFQRGFKFDYGKNAKSDHYFSLTFLNAIHQQKLALIENLIKKGCRLNSTHFYSNHQWFNITPLMMAVMSGNIKIVKMLVKSGANINQYDKNGHTALMLAEEMKYKDIIEFLKCQPHEPKKHAVPAHKKEIAKALVYRKSSKSDEISFLMGQKKNKNYYELFSLARSNQAGEGKSLEELAIKAVSTGALIDLLPHIAYGSIQNKLFDRYNFRNSNSNLVIETHEYLVDSIHKLKPYPSDKYKDVRWISALDISNLRYLISNYDCSMIESLIKNQPLTSHTYFHSLHKLNVQLFDAIQKNSCRTVEELLAAGADVNSLNDKKLTPLAIACDTPHPSLRLIQILIENGALLNYACCYEAKVCDTPNPNLKRIRTLIQNGELFNDTGFYEMGEIVPLQLALLQKSKLLVSLLCENGANLNQKLGKSTTPLLTACWMEDITLIEELIRYGADFKTNENKGILARLCAIPCTDRLFDYLLDHADINGLSSQLQCTPLMVCVKLGDINRIKKLLAKGVDPSIRHPRNFKSALDFALEKKIWDVVGILNENNDISQKYIVKVKEISGLPTEMAEYTDKDEYTETRKSKTKIFKTLVDGSILQANIFNKIANFEEAFKEFYDKNINHLRLFRERESDKLFNTDNEAVHVLLDKFSNIAQSGTVEEKKLVKSFFLNRTDHRDLFHLQEGGNLPLTLPYNIPYIKFVMEQEYRGKEFQLFSLSEILQFYHSPDVSFYHETPVQTWLKIIQAELPSSDLSIDTLVASITLLDNLCGDKSVIEKIFKQYIDTFDQLPVLSQEVATLVRLVLVFFNSPGSSSCKKSLLDKLNWNQLSDTHKDCHLAIEDIIILYRIHDTTLTFPSVKKQKLLGNLCLAKIKNISFVNYKISLLERLMFSKNGNFNLPLVDSVFRNEVITLWIEIILIKYGPDDGSYAYYHTMKQVINRISSEVHARDKHHLFQQLANSIETQFGLSAYISDILSSSEAKDDSQEKNALVIVSGNALKMISPNEIDKIKTLDFLASPITAESLDITVQHAMTIHNRKDINELVMALSGCGDHYSRQYDKNDVKDALIITYHQFWNLNMEDRAGVINYLLIPSDIDSSLKHIKDTYEQVFLYALHKLFPNAQSDEREKFLTAFLIDNLRTIDEYKCEYLLACIITTSNEADSDGKASDPVHKFALLCKHLGPAYAKLGQAIQTDPKTPKNMCRDFDHIQDRDNLPNRWDVWCLMDKVLPPHERENIARVGSLLGFASHNYVIECKLKNKDEQMVLLLLRDDAEKDASEDFAHLSKVVDVCEHVTLQSHKETILDMIAEGEEIPTIEMNKDCGDKEQKLADILSLGLKIPVQVENTSYQIEFAMNTAFSRGKGYQFLDHMWGYELSDLPNVTNQDKMIRKAIAKAIIKTELKCMLAGYFFDCDRHDNQLRVQMLDNNNIRLGLFDFGEMSLKKAGKIELQQFANVLYSLSRASSHAGIMQCNELLDSTIKSVKQAYEPITYLMHIRETFLAMQDLQKELIDSDLIELLKSIHTYDVHPLLRAEISYSINKTNLIQYQPTKHNKNFSQLNHVTNFMSFGLFAPCRTTTVKPYNSTKFQQKNTLQNKHIFVTTALRNSILKQGGMEDLDYFANYLADSLKERFQDKITFIPVCKDETSLYQQIGFSTPKGAQPILHAIVNAHDISFRLTPERLQTFKDKGGYVVVTVIGFAKYPGLHDFNLKFDTITLLEQADYAIFLDENDKKSAIEFAEKMRKKIPPSRVIVVPASVPPNKALAERGKDILSFGIIRAGKGLSHVSKLAKLMKESDDLTKQGKNILVVGTTGQDQEGKCDRTLHNLALEVYPTQAKAIDMKKPYELIALLKEIQSDSEIKPALPVEFHLNVTENELSKLFDRCTYAYLPTFRGATLSNSEFLSSLMNKLVTYVHEGKFTPECLKAGGLYQNAVSMIKYDPEKEFFSYSAETVLADVIKREKDPKLNIKTIQATSNLINEQLSLSSVIASQHDDIYSKGISLKAMKNYPFYYLPDERSLTIPRPEIAYPLPKRYLGFNRLSQTLRHVSSVVFRTIKIEFRCNPKEVQVAMLVDKLHVSSNFHSERLAPALLIIMTQENVIEKWQVAKCYRKIAKFDRVHRHLNSLKQFVLNDHIFDTTVDKGIAEIKQGLGIPKHSNLSVEEITSQFVVQMKALRSVLRRCTNGNSFGVIVHAPPEDDTAISALLKNGETATRHAERNIVQYLTDHAECTYNKSLSCFSFRVGKHVLVPIEGRFVPCGFCYEQEAIEQMPGEGGLFDPIQKRFLLHRSSFRAGKFFAREIQFFTSSSFHSDSVQARNRSVQVLEDIANSSTHLNTYGRPIVMAPHFNTDSEDSS